MAHGAACDAACDASMTSGKCKCLADVSRCGEEEGACECCRVVVCHAEGGEEGGHRHGGSVTGNRSNSSDFIKIPIGIRKTDQLFSISFPPSSLVTYFSPSLRPRYRRTSSSTVRCQAPTRFGRALMLADAANKVRKKRLPSKMPRKVSLPASVQR